MIKVLCGFCIEVFDSIMDSIGTVCDEIVDILENEDGDIKKLMTLVNTNHNLLRA